MLYFILLLKNNFHNVTFSSAAIGEVILLPEAINCPVLKGKHLHQAGDDPLG